MLSTLSLVCQSPERRTPEDQRSTRNQENALQQLNWKSVGIGELLRGSDIISRDGSLFIESYRNCPRSCHAVGNTATRPLEDRWISDTLTAISAACFRRLPPNFRFIVDFCTIGGHLNGAPTTLRPFPQNFHLLLYAFYDCSF
jgi:hypothetical protein